MFLTIITSLITMCLTTQSQAQENEHSDRSFVSPIFTPPSNPPKDNQKNSEDKEKLKRGAIYNEDWERFDGPLDAPLK